MRIDKDNKENKTNLRIIIDIVWRLGILIVPMHVPMNHDDGGLLPEDYLHLVNR